MTVHMMVTDTQSVVQIDCNMDITVPEDEKNYHVVDLMHFAALAKCKQHVQGKVLPGKTYNVKILAVIVELPADEDLTK